MAKLSSARARYAQEMGVKRRKYRPSFEVSINKRVLKKFMAEVPERIDEAVSNIAYQGLLYVTASFNQSSGMPGNPPLVDTGKLRGGINVQREGAGVYNINTGRTEYAPYLEFGTSRMPPYPFMAPMAKELRKDAPKVLRHFLNQYIREKRATGE